MLPSFSSSRQMMMAWKVNGLSHSPAIIVSRPASMRLAMAISPSRDRSSTEPISRRYIRTGSSVRSPASRFWVVATALPAPVSATSVLDSSVSRSSASSDSSSSTTLMPMSFNMAIVSSICSEVTSSAVRTELSFSIVTKPRFLAALIIFLTASSDRSSRGLSGVSGRSSTAASLSLTLVAIRVSLQFASAASGEPPHD